MGVLTVRLYHSFSGVLISMLLGSPGKGEVMHSKLWYTQNVDHHVGIKNTVFE